MMSFQLVRWLYGRNIKSQFFKNLRDHSKNNLRLIRYHWESIIAQKLRRGHKTFYSRILGENCYIKLLQGFRSQVQRNFNASLLLCSIGLYVFDWESERITYDSIKMYFNEIEMARKLQMDTLICKYCKKARKITEKSPGVDYCKCTIAKTKDSWEPYLEREGMIVWRKEEKSSLFSYKVYAKYLDITANDFLHVQTDLEYRKKWDDSAVTLEIIDSDPADIHGSHVIYWEMRWPKLFANRDYVYCRRYFIDKAKNVIVICNKSTYHPKCPVDQNKQRVEEYWSYMVIRPSKSFHEPGLEYVLTYYDNPGLAIPSTITSWVAQKQMPEFLEKLYMATKRYAQQKKHHVAKKSSWDSFQKKDVANKRSDSERHHSRVKNDNQDRENDSGLIM